MSPNVTKCIGRPIGFRSIEEINKILDNTGNIVYRTIYKLILGTGLKPLEITNLRIKNLKVKEPRPFFGFTDRRTQEFRISYIPYMLLEDLMGLLGKALREGSSDESFLFPGMQPRRGKGAAGVGERTLRQNLRIVAPVEKYPDISLSYLQECFGWFLLDLGASNDYLYTVMERFQADPVIKFYEKTKNRKEPKKRKIGQQ